MSRLRSFSLLVLLIVLTGCGAQGTPAPAGGDNNGASPGGGNGGGGDTGGGDPCRLVTIEEVEAVLEVEVAEAVAAAGTTCSFNDEEGFPIFSYSVIETSDAIDVRSTFESQRENAEEVENIGDGALWFGSGAMYVIKGDTLMNMVVTLEPEEGDETEFRAEAEELARIAAGRM